MKNIIIKIENSEILDNNDRKKISIKKFKDISTLEVIASAPIPNIKLNGKNNSHSKFPKLAITKN